MPSTALRVILLFSSKGTANLSLDFSGDCVGHCHQHPVTSVPRSGAGEPAEGLGAAFVKRPSDDEHFERFACVPA